MRARRTEEAAWKPLSARHDWRSIQATLRISSHTARRLAESGLVPPCPYHDRLSSRVAKTRHSFARNGLSFRPALPGDDVSTATSAPYLSGRGGARLVVNKQKGRCPPRLSPVMAIYLSRGNSHGAAVEKRHEMNSRPKPSHAASPYCGTYMLWNLHPLEARLRSSPRSAFVDLGFNSSSQINCPSSQQITRHSTFTTLTTCNFMMVNSTLQSSKLHAAISTNSVWLL
ncbi:hypothetical protein GE09DRAFT_208116 [Coniochaeta sp. 2T2.1]|nr:hypothetical protein GE09DRAFT_208116 [Coniochaeta sp. 2T2.1]